MLLKIAKRLEALQRRIKMLRDWMLRCEDWSCIDYERNKIKAFTNSIKRMEGYYIKIQTEWN